MATPPEGNGLNSRVVALERDYLHVREDVAEIKADVKGMRRDFNARGAGMTRPEKIALASAGAAVIGAIIAAVALIQTAPGA